MEEAGHGDPALQWGIFVPVSCFWGWVCNWLSGVGFDIALNSACVMFCCKIACWWKSVCGVRVSRFIAAIVWSLHLWSRSMSRVSM